MHHFLRSVLALLALATAVDAQWVESPREGWADLTSYYVDTRKAFDFDGEVRDFFADGHAVSVSVFVTVAAGLLPGMDAWVQVPYHRLRYSDARGDRLRSGIGDSAFYLRIQPLFYIGSNLPLAVRAGVKVPVGDFAVDSEVIPLGDGQTDWELIAEIGHSFYPLPGYVSGWVGYRWRQRNDVALRDFGDEVFFLAQAGGTRGALGFQWLVEGLRGTTTPVFERIPLPSAARSLLQITPKISYEVGPGAVSIGARISLAGKNLPSGKSLVLGYFSRWSL